MLQKRLPMKLGSSSVLLNFCNRAILICCFPPLIAADVHPNIGRLKTDLEYLTSPQLAGRASLAPGAKLAADYVVQQFQQAGIQPANGNSYLQEFTVTENTLDAATSTLTMGELQLVAANHFTGAFHRNLSIKANAVFVGYGITAPEYGYDDYKTVDARGKIVFLFDREPQEADPKSIFLGLGLTRYANYRSKLKNAQSHGAVAMVIFRSAKTTAAVVRNPSPPRGNAERQIEDGVKIPFINLNEAGANKLLPNWRAIQEKLDESAKPQSFTLPNEVELQLKHSNFKQGTTWNVVGMIEGSDRTLKRETILLTSHHDHLPVRSEKYYPGANDNGSGTAGVIELARLFRESKQRPKRTILFVSFGAEENFLLGSFYFVDHPLRPLVTIRAVINLDMIARNEAHTPSTEGRLVIPSDTRNQLNLVGTIYSPGLQKAIEKGNRRVGLQFDTKFERDSTQNILFRCDHYPFLLADIPAVWLFGGLHPGYHEPVDTVDKLDFTKLEKVLRLAFQTVMELANSKASPGFRTGP